MPKTRTLKDLTWSAAVMHVIEVLAKLITYNTRVKLERNKKAKAELEATDVIICPRQKRKSQRVSSA